MARYIDKKTAQLDIILIYLESFKTKGKNAETDKDFYEYLEDDISRNRDCHYYCKVLRLIIDKKLYNFTLSPLNKPFVYILQQNGLIDIRTKSGYDEEGIYTQYEFIEVIPHYEQKRGDYEKYSKQHSILNKSATGFRQQKWWL